MKKKDIVLDGVYTDGKGNVRKVISVGPEFKLYNGQYENDNLRSPGSEAKGLWR